ncbi:MAG: histidine phosphatase family protein [Bacteroidales bacterium]
MRRELFILRHAKSSWSEVEKSDKDRALKPKGIREVSLLTKNARQVVGRLEVILTSPANRAVHTAVLFAEGVGFPLDKILLKKEIYEADEDTLKKVIAGQSPEIRSMMVVGHNPTVSYFINSFLPEPIFELPTSGFVCLYFDTPSWDNISKLNMVEFDTSFIAHA